MAKKLWQFILPQKKLPQKDGCCSNQSQDALDKENPTNE